jgi:hypothetical protein
MATVTLNRAGLERLLVSPTGPVMLNMLRRGQRVLTLAKATCPVHLGVLRESLKTTIAPHGIGNMVEVGSDLRELLYVEEGTGPAHEPNPNPAYFPPWNKPEFALWAGEHGLAPYQLALHISIHGTQPTHFMRDALRNGVGH